MSQFYHKRAPRLPRLEVARKVGREALRRLLTLRAAHHLCRAGWSIGSASYLLQISATNLYRWADHYREHGLAGLDFKPRRKALPRE